MTATEPVAEQFLVPRWVAASLDVKAGRDPLGLQTTTQDRLMPRLLPGILELTRRARYLSFHAYLLDRYRELRRPEHGAALSVFIKEREWEYGLAVLNCPHRCGLSPVGAQTLRPLVGRVRPPYPRGESVETAFGGYGLFYRSPLAQLGIVARAGTPLGDTPIPIDVLYPTERARRLADTFREAIESTAYERKWMLTRAPIPLEVLAEYARVCCLCQLRHWPAERDAVHDAIFGDDPASAELTSVVDDAAGFDRPAAGRTPESSVIQRRRSVAHYLTLVDAAPAVVQDEGAYREALWAPAKIRSPEHGHIAGQWAGLVAKDVWQDALCSVWSEFCRAGVAATNARGGVGVSWNEVYELARSLVGGPPTLEGEQPTSELAASISVGGLKLPGVDRPIAEAPLEALRAATNRIDTATSGLVVLLELHRRAAPRTDAGWEVSTAVGSAWQPPLATVLDGLTAHLADGPTVADTLWWVAHRFAVRVHERIAYSKLPEHTFRFRWDDGRMRFFDNGIGRFPLAAIRHEPLASLTHDLGFWERDDSTKPMLTARGSAFVAEALP